MQIFTLRVGQRIRIGVDTTVTVLEINRLGTKLKVVTPESKRIVRLPALVQGALADTPRGDTTERH